MVFVTFAPVQPWLTQLQMKKTLLLLTLLVGMQAIAQNSPEQPKKKIDLTKRTKDHIMLQYGMDAWTNRPDSVRTGNGFSRHFNAYIMMDKPFRLNPKMSLAYGVGIASSNIFFNKVDVDLKSTAARLPFTIVDSFNHFNKYKVTSIYAEIPIELRWFSNPENMNKSWKFAIGAKVGTLIKSYTKGKEEVDKLGRSLYGKSYVEKESNRRHINPTAIALTGRIGYGIVSLQGSYQVTSVLREGAGPQMNRFTVGIGISGL